MDPRLMPPEEREARAHIVIGAGPPATEAGRIWHEQWHRAGPGAPKECGTLGCGFLGRILAIEQEATDNLHRGLKRLRDTVVRGGLYLPPGPRDRLTDEIDALLSDVGSTHGNGEDSTTAATPGA